MKKYIRQSSASPEDTIRVTAIKACAPSFFKDYKKNLLGIPQNIFSLAACTPDWVELQLVDEMVNIKVDYRTKSDIIVIMFSTPDAYRAYEIADKFRKKNKTVILGGLHASFLIDEALEHCDSLLIGECEGIWEELLNDWSDGNLKTIYERDTPVDLDTLKPFPTDIIPHEKYGYSWSVVVSRGCKNKCSYCTVHKFFPKFRTRKISDIVEEIANCGTDFIELKADNMLCDRDYALALFKAIEPLDIVWMTALEPAFANDLELLEAAAKSGLRAVLLGIETPKSSVLISENKGHMDLNKLKDQLDLFHSYDIEIDAAMLFGFDGHDDSIWQETLDFVLDIGVDVTHGVVPIPFPGTDFYNTLDRQGRLLTKDWSKYEGTYIVYQHPVFKMNEIYKKIAKYEKDFKKRHKPIDFKWKKRWG